jgi:hypothetical protein
MTAGTKVGTSTVISIVVVVPWCGMVLTELLGRRRGGRKTAHVITSLTCVRACECVTEFP